MKLIDLNNSLNYNSLLHNNTLAQYFYCSKQNKIFKIEFYPEIYHNSNGVYIRFSYRDSGKLVDKTMKINTFSTLPFYSDIKLFYKDYKTLISDNQALADKYLNSYNTKMREIQENKNFLESVEKDYAEYLI